MRLASNYLINMTITYPKISAVPVRPSHSWKFTDCMPTGRFICPISPAIKGRMEEERNEEVRNEEADAAGLQNVLNKYDHHSS